MIFKQKRKKS